MCNSLAVVSVPAVMLTKPFALPALPIARLGLVVLPARRVPPLIFKTALPPEALPTLIRPLLALALLMTPVADRLSVPPPWILTAPARIEPLRVTLLLTEVVPV